MTLGVSRINELMKQKYIWLGQIAFWTLFLLKDMLLYRSYRAENPIYWAIVIPTGYWLIALIAFYSGYGLIFTYVIRATVRQIWGVVLRICFAFGLVILARYTVEFGFFKPVLAYDNYSRNTHFTWTWFAQNAFLYYWSWVLYGFLYGFAERYVHQQQRERELMQAEVSLLRAQVNPHFLFNVLNDIYTLALTQPNQTPDALLKLSNLLRYMLYNSQVVLVPLADEIDYVKSYIDLEQIGQKGRVCVETFFSGSIHNQQIAPMLLIPFVENAFKHGVLFNPAQAILVSLHVKADQLLFRCRNAKREGNKDKIGGIGLTNIRRRLNLEYPDRYVLHVDDTDSLFDVNLRLTF